MAWLEKQGFGKPLVHIVDREADSVAHLRRWSEAGSAWLVRVKEGSRVRFGDREMSLGEVGNELAYAPVREVEHRGRRATQWLASTQVVLVRKAKPKRVGASGKRVAAQAGIPLPVRLVVSRICDDKGRVWAHKRWPCGTATDGLSNRILNCSSKLGINWKAGSRKPVLPSSNAC